MLIHVQHLFDVRVSRIYTGNIKKETEELFHQGPRRTVPLLVQGLPGPAGPIGPTGKISNRAEKKLNRHSIKYFPFFILGPMGLMGPRGLTGPPGI